MLVLVVVDGFNPVGITPAGWPFRDGHRVATNFLFLRVGLAFRISQRAPGLNPSRPQRHILPKQGRCSFPDTPTGSSQLAGTSPWADESGLKGLSD